MKRILFFICMVLSLATLSSCFSDDSTSASIEVGNIEIAEFADKYTALSDNGEVLTITPEVTTGYDKSDLEYRWYIYEKSKEVDYMRPDGSYYDATLIGKEEKLVYNVDVPVGEYTIFLRVQSKTTGCFDIQKTLLSVSTRYTEGFYILKEKDGETEIDFVDPKDEKIDDIFTRMHGGPVKGKPVNLSVVYNHAYIDEDTYSPAYDHALCVTTDANKVRFLRTPDLAVVHDEKNMFYAEDGVDEMPYTAVNTCFKSIYLSSRGAYITKCGDDQTKPGAIGKFGNPEQPAGASPFIVKTGTYGTVYWNELMHGIYNVDMNGGLATIQPATGMPVADLKDYECLSAGSTYINYASKLYFLFSDRSNGDKVFYKIKADWGGTKPTSKNVLNPKLHFCTASYRSYNGFQAALAYCVDQGKLYAYTLEGNNTANEVQLHPKGIADTEEIVYAENVYWNQFIADYGASNFNYLVIGTQNGDSYHIYMYNMLGGKPDGTPVKTIKGTGKLKRVVFISGIYPPLISSLYLGYPY